MHRLTLSIAALVLAIISGTAWARPTLYQWIAAEGVSMPSAPVAMDGGKVHRISDFKGNVVLLNLWATWCTPCLKELPTLDRLEIELAKEGLVVMPLSVDINTNVKSLRDDLTAQGLALPHLAYDSTQSFAAFVGYGLPVTFLIDREGKVRYQYYGATDWTEADQTEKIKALLAQGK